MFSIELDPDDLSEIEKLKVPVPENEAERLLILRQTDLLDSSQCDPDFDRYTSLCKRIFNVIVFLITIRYFYFYAAVSS